MKIIIKILLFVAVFTSIGGLTEALARKIFCPPYYECAYISDVVSGNSNCPDGFICQPTMMMPDCPSVYVCFIKIPVPKDKSAAVAGTSTTTFAFFVSSIEPFAIYPGYEVTLKGQNLTASSSVMILKGVSLMTKLPFNSFKKEEGGTYTVKFTLPAYFVPGPYSLYLEKPDETKSNTISFYVTSVVPTSATPPPTGAQIPSGTSNTPITTTPTNSGNQNTTSNNNEDDTTTDAGYDNSDYFNDYYTTPTNTNNVVVQNSGAKFVIGNRVQTLDNLRVRNTPSIYGTLLTTQTRGSRGTIVGGPQNSDGHTWWNIDYSVGIDGWSAETYLAKEVTGGNSVVNNNEECYTFANDMSLGSSIDDVMYLQAAFMFDGFFIAESEKRPNSYFGNTTLAAAKAYQAKYGITPQAGYVGPKTRASLNMKHGCR